MMKKMTIAAIALVATSTVLGGFAASAQEVNKTYLRKGDQVIRVFTVEGKLFCRRVSDEFEMCNGMDLSSTSTYEGPNMKHPDMPSFMTFVGTAVLGSNKKMSIQGCVAGGICAKEVWDEQS
jgi:uncharacterized protein (DUF2147 family)